jgi:hypothetical protein
MPFSNPLKEVREPSVGLRSRDLSFHGICPEVTV